MTTLDQAERSARTAAKRARHGEEDLRHRFRPGMRDKLNDVMTWNRLEILSEAIQLLVLNAESVQLLPPATGTEPFRHYARPGIIAKLKTLAGGDEKQIGLVIESLIAAAHAAGPDGSALMLAIPRHKIKISPKVARILSEFVPPPDDE